MTAPSWPDTLQQQPPVDHPYRCATWLIGRYPRLARLAERIRGVVEIADGALFVDLDHLAAVIAAVPAYEEAWDSYERAHSAPQDENDWYRWQDSGPKADAIVRGLSDFLVMSSGEVASLRLLVTLANERTPFCVGDLRSLDADGQRMLADWTRALTADNAPLPTQHGPSLDPRPFDVPQPAPGGPSI